MSESITKQRPGRITIGKMVWISIGLGISYWVLDAFMDSFFFEGDSFLSELIFPDAMCLAMRLINWAIITGFAVFAQIMLLKRKAAEDVVKQERDRAQMYLDISPVIMLVLAKDGRIMLLNRAGCTILGCDEQEVLGKDWFDEFVPESDRAAARAHFIGSFQGGPPPAPYSESHVRTRSCRERLIAWRTAVVTDNSGAETASLISGQDITELKIAELEREKLIHELQAALAEVKTLGSLLPICANCKKIRDDKGYWHQVEVYIGARAGTKFSHGICPECLKGYYDEIARMPGSGDKARSV